MQTAYVNLLCRNIRDPDVIPMIASSLVFAQWHLQQWADSCRSQPVQTFIYIIFILSMFFAGNIKRGGSCLAQWSKLGNGKPFPFFSLLTALTSFGRAGGGLSQLPLGERGGTPRMGCRRQTKCASKPGWLLDMLKKTGILPPTRRSESTWKSIKITTWLRCVMSWTRPRSI